MAFLERNKCEVCGSVHIYEIVSIPYRTSLIAEKLIARHEGSLVEKDLENNTYNVSKCENCGFMFQRYIPDEEMSLRIYSYQKSRIKRSLDKKQNAPINYFIKYAILSEKIAYLLSKNPHELNILDFGSGWGHFLLMARAHGYSTAGVEISPERRSYSQKNNLNITSKIEELGEQKFDFIYSDQTFEHIPDPLYYLKELTGRLKKDGIIFISVPDCSRTETKLNKSTTKIVDDIYPLEHINGFTHESLVFMAKKAGLEPLSPFSIFAKLSPQARLGHNIHFLQEGLKSFYTQNLSTDIYFVSKI